MFELTIIQRKPTKDGTYEFNEEITYQFEDAYLMFEMLEKALAHAKYKTEYVIRVIEGERNNEE